MKQYITLDTSVSIIGALFVAFGNSFVANCIWSIGNLLLIRRNYKINKDYSQVTLFIVFEIVAVLGIINHFMGVY